MLLIGLADYRRAQKQLGHIYGIIFVNTSTKLTLNGHRANNTQDTMYFFFTQPPQYIIDSVL
jgi:hypothetical protein